MQPSHLLKLSLNQKYKTAAHTVKTTFVAQDQTCKRGVLMKKSICDDMYKAINKESAVFAKYGPEVNLGVYSALHLREHSYEGKSRDDTLLAAAGRLEWLLMDCRDELNGMFTEDEILLLLDCFKGEVFSPFELESLAAPLCVHLGIDPESACENEADALLEKLVRLTAAQRLTLADALEQTWHRGVRHHKQSLRDFFSYLGIELR
jgi:hypothetical protein